MPRSISFRQTHLFDRAAIFAARNSSLYSAVSSFIKQIDCKSTTQLLELDHSRFVPGCGTLWIDLFLPEFNKYIQQPSGMINALESLTKLVRMCVQHHTPLVWFRGFSRRNAQFFEKLNLKADIHWTVVCSCQVDSGQVGRAHLKRYLFVLNMPHFDRDLLRQVCRVYPRSRTITSSHKQVAWIEFTRSIICLLYTSPSPRDQRGSGMPCCG